MAFCGVTNIHIVVATCPLPKNACYWQHRENKLCKYTAEELTLQEFCDLVGVKLPNDLELQKADVIAQLKKDYATP